MNINSNNHSLKYLNKLKDSIFQISHAVHDIDNIDLLFRFIHREVSKLVHTNNFYIALLNEEGNSIHFPYHVDVNDSIPEESIDLGIGLTSLILKSKEPLLIDKKDYLKLIKDKVINEFGTPPESWLGVPLVLHNDKAIGIIAIQSYSNEIIFNKDDLDILSFASEQIALAIEKFNAIKHIEEISKYDELTKLPNKKLFFDLALKEITKNDKTLLFVLIDLDDFMLINDNYGHDIGNKIIQKISMRLKKIIHKAKPSNLNSFISNKVENGKLKSNIDFYLNDKH